MQSLTELKNMRVTVMGLGLNGGGLASASFFARHGAQVTVTDLKNAEALAPSLNKLKHIPNMRFVTGEHRIEDFKTADIVIKNPGVKREGNRYLDAACRIETDISVFLAFSNAPILAVTGSKGKSSTASALYYGLTSSGYTAFLGGNITVSPLTFLDKTDSDTPVVLELSSWQLADLKDVGAFKPKTAVITPIMSDHLNWYGNMEAYVADKKIIYKNMDTDSNLICGFDDEWGATFARESNAAIYRYSERHLPDGIRGAFFAEDGNGYCRIGQTAVKALSEESRVPGKKMRQNVLNAALALMLYGAPQNSVADIMDSYAGIEHRMEFFYEAGGVAFYNDSAATIPEAAAAAIQAFAEPPVLICGGTDKRLDFTPLAESASHAKSIFLLRGSATELLIPLLKKHGVRYFGPFDGFEPLLRELKKQLETGDKAVLSPGAASFELFTNEFDRGNQFKEAVKRLF